MESFKAAVRAYEASRLGGGRCRELRKFFNFVAMKGGIGEEDNEDNACDLTFTCKGETNGLCNTIQTDCDVEGISSKKYIKRTRKQEQESVSCPKLSDEIKTKVDDYLEKRGAKVIKCVGFEYQPQLQDLPEIIDDTLFKAIVEEIDHLHTNYGLFHGDLHSGNVMLNPEDGQPVIIDFDTARSINNHDAVKEQLSGFYGEKLLENLSGEHIEHLAKANDYDMFLSSDQLIEKKTPEQKKILLKIAIKKIDRDISEKELGKIQFMYNYVKYYADNNRSSSALKDTTNTQ